LNACDRASVSFAVAGNGAALGSAGALQEHGRGGAVCDGSFWQGVDVPGEQLSCVIVDGCRSRCRAIPSCGSIRACKTMDASVREFQVPQAVLALKQGFGRLIRAKTDAACWRCSIPGCSACLW